MLTAKEILQELEQEAPATRRLLARVPAAKFDWRPHPKSMTLGALANHMAGLPKGIVYATLQPSFDPGALPPPAAPESEAALLERFDAGMEYARATLAAMPDADLGIPWNIMRGEKLLVAMPRGAAYRTILLNHIYHHRGQLTVYLRLNDVPLPSVYGPTADEPPLGM
ncbi:MAG TPA: DinB family protein [Gemmatimonadales bacterium]